MAIRIDFIKDFTQLLHFYFSENAKVRKNGTAHKLDVQQFLGNKSHKTTFFHVKWLVEESRVS